MLCSSRHDSLRIYQLQHIPTGGRNIIYTTIVGHSIKELAWILQKYQCHGRQRKVEESFQIKIKRTDSPEKKDVILDWRKKHAVENSIRKTDKNWYL